MGPFGLGWPHLASYMALDGLTLVSDGLALAPIDPSSANLGITSNSWPSTHALEKRVVAWGHMVDGCGKFGHGQAVQLSTLGANAWRRVHE